MICSANTANANMMPLMARPRTRASVRFFKMSNPFAAGAGVSPSALTICQLIEDRAGIQEVGPRKPAAAGLEPEVDETGLNRQAEALPIVDQISEEPDQQDLAEAARDDLTVGRERPALHPVSATTSAIMVPNTASTGLRW